MFVSYVYVVYVTPPAYQLMSNLSYNTKYNSEKSCPHFMFMKFCPPKGQNELHFHDSNFQNLENSEKSPPPPF
jgi:hypothetical protein